MPEDQNNSSQQPEQFQPQTPDLQSSEPSVPIEDRDPVVPLTRRGNLQYRPLKEGTDEEKA